MAHQASGTLPERPPGGSAHSLDLSGERPRWCVMQHGQDEPLDQQAHESDTTPFPVIEIERRRGPDETPAPTLAYDIRQPNRSFANDDQALMFLVALSGIIRTSRTYRSASKS